MENILYLHTGAELYGADIVLLELLKGIDKTLFNPIVILPSDGKLVEKLRENNIEVHIMQYPILRRQYFTIRGIMCYVSSYIKSSRAIAGFLKNRKISAIHVNTIAVLEGIYLSRVMKVPVIWHIHEILDSPKIVYYLTSLLVGIFSKKVVAVSESVKKHLVASGFIKNSKVSVVYNGVNNEIFHPDNEVEYLREELNIPKESFIIGMIGRVNAIKGQEEFIKIVEPLIKEYRNVYGIIVGDAFAGQEWRVDNLKSLIMHSEARDRLLYLGYRSDSANLHCLFDVYVLPSTRPDSLPTVVLESMASRKVVVGYKNGGIIEMVVPNETGFLEEIGKADAISNHIGILIKDREYYLKMAEAGYCRQKELFTRNKFILGIEDVYKSII